MRRCPRPPGGIGRSMFILGINAFHADSAACLVRDGELLAAAEEERFRRIKHWAGFPSEAIRYCLAEAGIAARDLDHVAINRDPKANLLQKALFAFARRPSLELVRAAASRTRRASQASARPLAAALRLPSDAMRGQVPPRRASPGAPRERLLRLAVRAKRPWSRSTASATSVERMWGVGAGRRHRGPGPRLTSRTRSACSTRRSRSSWASGATATSTR